MYEHRCLENIKELYTCAGKFDAQQQHKSITESEMVSTPEIFSDNSPISPGTSVPVINPNARKSLHLFTEVLDIKKKTTVRLVGASKSKRKKIRSGSILW